MAADSNLQGLKHRVLTEVASLAYEGTLEEKRDGIAKKLIPGPNPTYRCCIYKEREIIRQRVRLAEGKPADVDNDDQILQVIYSACADCPISAYTVTENCQNCLGKACLSACKFGAIKLGEKKMRIDASKCKECGQCAKSCPYNAIAHLKRPCKNVCPVDAISYDENGISVIDEKKCIRCGHCIHACPFGAIDTRMSLVKVINEIKSDKKVYVMVAPSAEGQFGEGVTMSSIKTAMKQLGFDDMIELGLGGDLTANYEAKEWLEAYNEGKKMTTSCCPAFVNLIKRHYPMLEENISTTLSPMAAVSRLVKTKEPDAVTVFLGPCVAKKSEAYEHNIEGNADYVISFSELRAMLAAKNIELKPEENTYQEASVYGKYFGNSGGVTAAVKQALKESGFDQEVKVNTANGVQECKRALLMLKANKLQEDFIEGMVCEGGCVNGPCSNQNYMTAKKTRDNMIGSADQRNISDNLSHYNLKPLKMNRTYKK